VDELMTPTPIPVFNVNEPKYIEQSRKIVSLENKKTYPIIHKSNRTLFLCELTYIGNNYFLSIMTRELFQNISNYNNNYAILYEKCDLKISSIVSYTLSNANNFIITMIQIDNPIHNFYEFNIITHNAYLELERTGINVCVDINNLENNITINAINDTDIICSCGYNITLGSPIYLNNTIIGIYYKKSGDNVFFYRLSNNIPWLDKFNVIYKPNTVSNPGNVSYSQEQFYKIIISLNDRIKVLEEQLKNK
jgi:hypothetical protein